MKAKLYVPAKTATQSGKARAGEWVMEYEAMAGVEIEPLMGYAACEDMMRQVRLRFPNREAAVEYAQRCNIDLTIIEPNTSSAAKIAYADNFSHNRDMPWTH